MGLIESPFNHTILVDSDVIWFKNPELLFEAPAYQSTGALYFRDRLTTTNSRNSLTRGNQRASLVYKYVADLNIYLKSLDSSSESNSLWRQLLADDHSIRSKHKIPRIQPRVHRGNGSSLIMRNITAMNPKNLLSTNTFWYHFATGKGYTSDHMQVIQLNK
jgi:hypothetical protein